MNKLALVAALVIGAYAANCGTYKYKGVDLLWGYKEVAMKVYCNLFTGYVYNVDFSENFHESKDYSDKRTINHHYVYKMKKKDGEDDPNEATYEGKLTTAKTRFYDYARFKKNHAAYTCTPEPGSKTYKMEDISCSAIIVGNRYAWVKSAMNKAFSSAVLFSDNKEGKRQVSGSFQHDVIFGLDRSSSFGGCWPWWLLTITIILVVGILCLIGVGVAALFQKKSPKKKGKK